MLKPNRMMLEDKTKIENMPVQWNVNEIIPIQCLCTEKKLSKCKKKHVDS